MQDTTSHLIIIQQKRESSYLSSGLNILKWCIYLGDRWKDTNILTRSVLSYPNNMIHAWSMQSMEAYISCILLVNKICTGGQFTDFH